jgi:cobalt-zinc-cadmium efflux system outer membrane protein
MTISRILCITLIGYTLSKNTAFAADDEISLQHLNIQQAQLLFHANSRELLAAQRALQATEANAITAAQKPNPSLSIGVSSLNLNRSTGNKNPENQSNSLQDQTLNSTVQISQLFERGDKRELRIASAKNAIQASKFDAIDTERQWLLALNASFYDLLLAQEIEAIQTSNVSLYEKTLQAAELRLKAGDIAASDVSRIRVDLLKTKNDLRQAQANKEKAQSNLAYLIGKENIANNIHAEDRWPDAQDLVGISTYQNINQRPDVLAAEARAKQAEENTRLANSLKTRDVNIALQYQHFPGQMPGSGDNTIGAAISIPLFTNYEYQGEIARAQVDLTAAQEAKEQARAAALIEAERANADLQASTEKLQRFDAQILTEAQKAADAAEFAYNHGATGITDLLDSRRVLRALQLDAASVRADFAKSLAAWKAAMTSTDKTVTTAQ